MREGGLTAGLRFARRISVLDWFFGCCVLLLTIYYRTATYSQVFSTQGIRLATVDAYLHFRRILLAVHSYPTVPGFDSYVGYPNGTTNTWPPLWDFLVATTAMIAGLGRPDEYLILTVAAVFPVVVGVLTIAAIGLLTGSVFGRNAVWPSCFLAAVAPALRLNSSLGNVDHHAGVTLTTVIALALSVLVVKRRNADSSNVRQRYGLAAVLGISLAAGMLIWLGSVVLVALIGSVAFIQNVLYGQGKNATARSFAVAYLTAGAVVAPFTLTDFAPSFSSLSSLHLLLLLGIGIVFLGLGVIESRRQMGMVMVGTLCVVGVGMWFLKQDIILDLVGAVVAGVIKAFGRYPWAEQTSEWLPLLTPTGRWDVTGAEVLYGKTIYLVPLALVWLVYRHMGSERGEQKHLWYFYILTVITAGMALAATVFHQLFAPFAVILLGCSAAEICGLIGKQVQNESLTSQGNRGNLGAVFLPVIIMLALWLNSADANRLGMIYPPDLFNTMEWIRKTTPSPGEYLDNETKPAYGIISTWSYGDLLLAVSKRPTVADGGNEWNLPGYVLSQSFFQSPSDEDAVRIVVENNLRYVVVGVEFTYIEGDLWQAGPPARWVNPNPPKNVWQRSISQQIRSSLTYFRLYDIRPRGFSQFRPLSNFRLVHAGRESGFPLLVYEYVPGAKVIGKTEPGASITAVAKVRANDGNEYGFQFTGTADTSGDYQIVLPYASDGVPYETKAEGPYVITLGERQDTLSVRNLTLTNEQVVRGETIRLN